MFKSCGSEELWQTHFLKNYFIGETIRDKVEKLSMQENIFTDEEFEDFLNNRKSLLVRRSFEFDNLEEFESENENSVDKPQLINVTKPCIL